MKKILYYTIMFIISILFIDGLYIIWTSEFAYFMSFLFTAFGLVGLLWLGMILHDKLINIK